MIPEDYQPVEDRLREFWERFPAGKVVTELVHHGSTAGEVLVFRADVYRGDELRGDVPAATGYAHQRLLEKPPPGKNGPNIFAPEWTSPWEVAETSAVGRALANLGLAAKGKRPSREEVQKASAQASAITAPRVEEEAGSGKTSRAEGGPASQPVTGSEEEAGGPPASSPAHSHRLKKSQTDPNLFNCQDCTWTGTKAEAARLANVKEAVG